MYNYECFHRSKKASNETMNRNGSTNEMSRAVNSGSRPHVRLQLDKRSVVRAGDEQCNAPPFVVPTGGTCRASRSKSGADDDTTRKQVSYRKIM